MAAEKERTKMFDIHRKELMWGGRKLVLETGHIARQSDGAVMVTYDETSVLCTAVAAREPRQGIDFFPLTVHTWKKPMPPVKFRAASSSVRAAPRKTRR